MYYAYVIKSEVTDFLYKGHCEDLNKRLKEHNSGYTESIKKFIPFQIVYFETFAQMLEDKLVAEVQLPADLFSSIPKKLAFAW